MGVVRDGGRLFVGFVCVLVLGMDGCVVGVCGGLWGGVGGWAGLQGWG